MEELTPEEKEAAWESWVTDEDISQLTDANMQVSGKVGPGARASRLLETNAPFAAQVVADLAMRGTNEKVRLDAAKYLLDRVLGRPETGQKQVGEDDPLAAVYNKILREPTADERKAGARISE